MNNKKFYKELLSDGLKNIGYIFYNKTKVKFTKNKNQKIPRTWKRIYFKIYPRFEQIKLKINIDNIQKNAVNLLFIKRKTLRNFTKNKLNFKELSDFLFSSAGINNKTLNINDSRSYFTSFIYCIHTKEQHSNTKHLGGFYWVCSILCSVSNRCMDSQ